MFKKVIDDYINELMEVYQTKRSVLDEITETQTDKTESNKKKQNNTIEDDIAIPAMASTLIDGSSSQMSISSEGSDTLTEANPVPPEIGDDDDFTTFRAYVFTADKAYPIAKAKIRILKNDELVAFLMTDADGSTKEIRLNSPPAQNALEPFNTDKSTDYIAEIYADGFITKKNMMISAVGNTTSILQANMIPVPERIS